ncbi:hypothetical protein CPB86DRAFT_760803 [Serendipita vermifera]|nr:hypothetical protein CPB86DRAFT_760803 [Serendipita vermifera]
MAASTDNTFNTVQKRLQDGGDWDRIYAYLHEQLNEAGWLDELYDSAKERSRGRETIPVRQLLADLGSASTASISPEIKMKVIAMIQAAIEKMVEK